MGVQDGSYARCLPGARGSETAVTHTGVKSDGSRADDRNAVGKPLTVILASVGVLAALAAAAYAGLRLGGENDAPGPDTRATADPAKQAADTETERETETAGPEGLREAALSLVPAIASEPPSEDDLAEKDCTAGVDERPPPCIHFFFPTQGVTLAERERAVHENAVRNGWRPWRRKGLSEGFTWLRRGPYRARLALNPDHPNGFVDRLPALNEIMVFDLSRQPPPEPPPDPSGWSAEKRAFVARANAICARVNRDVKPLEMRGAKRDRDVLRLAGIWGDATDDVAALEPPAGDERAVAKIVVEFRRFERVLRILARVEGEMTLAAVVATFEQAKRAHKAAFRYGISGCSELR
jgi:hypothetical protein